MTQDLPLLLCALHSFAFAAFHLAFWRLFGWKRELAKVGLATRAIVERVASESAIASASHARRRSTSKPFCRRSARNGMSAIRISAVDAARRWTSRATKAPAAAGAFPTAP